MSWAEIYVISKFILMGAVLLVAFIFRAHKDVISKAFIAHALLGILTTTLDQTVVGHNLELGTIHDLITVYLFHYAFYLELKNNWHALIPPLVYTIFVVIAFTTDLYIPLLKSGTPVMSMYGGLNTYQYKDLEVILSILFIPSLFFWMWTLIASDDRSYGQVNKRLTFAFALLLSFSLKFYFDVLAPLLVQRMEPEEYKLVYRILLFISFFLYNALVITGLLWDRQGSSSSQQQPSSSLL